MTKTVIIGAGGTGGHILPAVAIAKELRDMGFKVVLAGLGSELENTVSMEFERRSIPALSPSMNPAKFIKYLSTLNSGIRVANRLIDELKPSCVLGMGNFSSVPLVVAASKKGVPVALHEQNAVGGRANRLLSRRTDLVMVGFEGTIGFPAGKVRVVGNPIRWSSIEPKKPEAYKKLGLDPERKTVVIFGGSQGAKILNDAFLSLSKETVQKNGIQWLLISGSKTYSETKEIFNSRNYKNAVLLEYLGEMDLAYSVADTMVARAGAMTVSEIECSGVPAILVPRALSINNHQMSNATYLLGKGNCVVLEESQTRERFEEAIFSMLAKQRNPRNCMHQDAGRRIAEILLAISR
ncbi:MAG: UDP-N-acetylglucosamine--N-acetylmuramyl-(pentapeptide) pyrophosphoryl-undecaprenol N-acetylglucosamine transferase [Caldisericales bacterium]|nr:UDP-N-acetylglucosamine--N-acetylmuramyl-(pentapeptide) pyrophosphoryl-undecaprenol N-acetylglucosamine transferase [Caldisericales bacterium]